jgi:hypothetical protein
MEQKIFILIIVIFLITTQMYDVVSNIIKYGFYFILLLAIINIIQPNIYKTIKENIINTLNGDYQLFSNIALYIKNILKPNKKYTYDYLK